MNLVRPNEARRKVPEGERPTAEVPSVAQTNRYMSSGELGEQYFETHEVKMNSFGFDNAPVLLYTHGLGPCIGVCIAWQEWAGIAHLGSLDEYDELPKFIEESKEFLPEDARHNICPVICGGDPEEYAGNIFESREVVVETLKKAGFGEPKIWWNQEGETTSLVAYLNHGIISVESSWGTAKESPIATD